MTRKSEQSENKCRAGLFLVGLLCLTIGLVGQYRHNTMATASSSVVNGKELPIYCVDTDKKQVALSFDCAWGARKSATSEDDTFFC